MSENGSQEPMSDSGIVKTYFEWLFEGNPLFVALKFTWTGMWLTAVLTFNWMEAGVLLGVGIAAWFVVNDYQNWYIEW